MTDLPLDVTKAWFTPVAAAWIEHGVRIVFIVIGAWLALTVGGVIAKRVIEQAKDRLDKDAGITERIRTVAGVLRNLYRYTIIFLASMLILAEFGVNLGPLLAGAGILGLAVGFGSQELVKDVIAGYFVLIEGEFGVGDTIKVGDHVGTVDRLGLRNIKIVAYDGSIHVIPNSQAASVVVLSKGFGRAVLKVGVPYNADLDSMAVLLEEYGAKLKGELEYVQGEPEVLGVSALSDGSVEFLFAVKVSAGRQAELERRMRREVFELLRQNGIAVAFVR